MGYWKSKVLPKIEKVFEKNGSKKVAVEACKSFDDSKEEISQEFEDKRAVLQPKIVEIYEASPAEIKTIVKDPKEAGLKKHSADVNKFLEELTKIEFPGSKAVCEASSKNGAALVPGPVLFLLEKVSTLIVVQEPAAQEETSSKAKEIAVEEEKKEEVVVVEEKAKVAEPAKVEEAK
ncbi:PREDICTED: plasma membrane-associated cation-binding protein 1 [Theobroma cacao]|uniref:Plasma membrane-associated cation-binding protein 1 n=1 Tax=Theobroma cacao TaxID=3641 RepID=A0AB32VWB9_THECC|nr:PREDICTED: plasma membrane-associated cation-binding protein 1 [Theobroma cacao]XP_017970231.1 PREDICTED: plasma membrane-associated cation-binding protein 1 [Theobroma cacao]XP_017970232.1 PREDICTED: plasma membrane-associated cation-binding protein 1 [Theobroma cacao]XP_017970233.1 PREDICTED: plasma membrane-associated cation-binding protein 1 [Theobroma cacao]XP_017970234.1 PREDICTED: plasma membrane-associated cation-binding protein 1 [Theobroma cacao]